MSFGYGVSDALTLVQLAWRTVEGARKACGEHDGLTKELNSLAAVLDSLHSEIVCPESLVNQADEPRRNEIWT